MRVFVAGGTGVVGRRVVPLLLRQGHEVTVLVRSAEKAEAVSQAGARAVEVNLFHPAGLARSIPGHEAVVNLATSIPPFSRAVLSRAWKLNDRIRAEGSRNLADAAAAAGVERFIQESVAYLYADAGSEWIFEDHLVRPSVITASAGEAENQARRLVEYGCATVVLRFGAFYGPDKQSFLEREDSVGAAIPECARRIAGGRRRPAASSRPRRQGRPGPQRDRGGCRSGQA
ncbi:NAD(P)-dependent oxidoreductase [Arthrobacter sp. ISL-30]|uniref:NAD-dependent epimerase/dehydratase family protein n=1 Tax=Arthrobacter sp. ISL-30 TaxID=2819109 RepID=UPI001BE4EF0D|nr:NAD(P)-dependent oxidoreductase [Arthrobacter sp. ISL-30]MBT2515014.1 NAD(P)-dependent oxidoreductase [Arthrobacter sp. ISL-30]